MKKDMGKWCLPSPITSFISFLRFARIMFPLWGIKGASLLLPLSSFLKLLQVFSKELCKSIPRNEILRFSLAHKLCVTAIVEVAMGGTRDNE